MSGDIEKLNRILTLLASSFAERAVYCSSLISMILERPSLLPVMTPNEYVHWIPALMSTQQACDWPPLKIYSHLFSDREIFSFGLNKSKM